MKKVFKSAIFAALAAFVGAQAATTYGPVTIETKTVTEKKNGNKEETREVRIAVIDGTSTEALDIPEDVVVDSVIFNRSFKNNTPSTIMLPFEMDTWRMKNVQAFQYVKVTKDWDGGQWVVYYNHVYANLMKPNTPYLIVPGADMDAIQFDISNNRPTVTLNTTTNDRAVAYSDKYGSWDFVGTYDYKQWNEGDSELGRVFGFAANNTDKVKAGEFVKGAAGIKIRPMRAYLKCLKINSTGAAKAAAGTFASIGEDEVIPDTLEVRIEEEDSTGGTTYVHLGTMNMRTGEMLPDNWVDMKGRKLYRKPTAKGIYYNNGVKVIIK